MKTPTAVTPMTETGSKATMCEGCIIEAAYPLDHVRVTTKAQHRLDCPLSRVDDDGDVMLECWTCSTCDCPKGSECPDREPDRDDIASCRRLGHDVREVTTHA